MYLQNRQNSSVQLPADFQLHLTQGCDLPTSTRSCGYTHRPLSHIWLKRKLKARS